MFFNVRRKSARRCRELAIDRFCFPDPYRCSGANIKEESGYLTAFIERVEPESLVLLPYHQGYEITQLYLKKKFLNYPLKKYI